MPKIVRFEEYDSSPIQKRHFLNFLKGIERDFRILRSKFKRAKFDPELNYKGFRLKLMELYDKLWDDLYELAGEEYMGENIEDGAFEYYIPDEELQEIFKSLMKGVESE